MTTLSKFPLFPDLPSELRLKIWSYTLPQPRVIPIRFSRNTNTYITTSPASPILHSCSESRSLYLTSYTKLIFSPKYESVIYVNLSVDTLYFDSLDCSPEGDLAADIARSPLRERIERIAIDAQLWEVLRVFKYDCLSEIRLLGGLKTMALVLVKEKSPAGIGEEGFGMEMQVVRDMQRESNTLGDEIRHVNWYLWSLRWEIEKLGEGVWREGRPAVQLWLW